MSVPAMFIKLHKIIDFSLDLTKSSLNIDAREFLENSCQTEQLGIAL